IAASVTKVEPLGEDRSSSDLEQPIRSSVHSTCFTMNIRACASPDHQRISTSSIPAEKPKVLVVDDEPQVLVALTDLLSDEFVVQTTSSPERALEMARTEGGISVVISDQRMPE